MSINTLNKAFEALDDFTPSVYDSCEKALLLASKCFTNKKSTILVAAKKTLADLKKNNYHNKKTRVDLFVNELKRCVFSYEDYWNGVVDVAPVFDPSKILA